jgi:hypothetical protein
MTSIEPDRLLLLATHGQVTGAGWVQRRDSSWVLLIEELDAGRCRLIERSRTATTTNKDTIAGKPGSARLGASALPFEDFVMAHRQLQRIRRRAEARWRASGSSSASAYSRRRPAA